MPPVASSSFTFTKGLSASIGFFLDGIEFVRISYTKPGDVVELTSRVVTSISVDNYRQLMIDMKAFMALVRTRFRPKSSAYSDFTATLVYQGNPVQMTLDVTQGILAYSLTYSNGMIDFPARGAATLSWSDFEYFVYWHEVWLQYVP